MKRSEWLVKNYPDRQDLLTYMLEQELRESKRRKDRRFTKETSDWLLNDTTLPHDNLNDLILKAIVNEKLCRDTSCLMYLPEHNPNGTCNCMTYSTGSEQLHELFKEAEKCNLSGDEEGMLRNYGKGVKIYRQLIQQSINEPKLLERFKNRYIAAYNTFHWWDQIFARD